MDDNGQGFRPGIYEHYKGGRYAALQLVHHHETRELMVLYVSLTTGSTNVREFQTKGADSWADNVTVADDQGTMRLVPRFRYIGPSLKIEHMLNEPLFPELIYKR